MHSDALVQAATRGDAAACFELARRHAGDQQIVQARRWLDAAAAAGHAQAASELGVLALYALDRAFPDAGVALAHFDAAARQGDAQALFHRALISLGGIVHAFDPASCLADLHAAAHAGHAPALRALGLAHAHLGDLDSARACFERAGAQGDPLSVFLLGCVTDDSGRAADLHALAAAHGIRRAALFARSGGSGPAFTGSDLPAAADAACLATPAFARVELRAQPLLAHVDAVLSPLECEYVIALAGRHLQRSMVHDPASGGPMLHPMRTSSSMTFPPADEEFWLRQLQRRLAALAGLPLANAEPLAVLRYAVGEEYRPHRDYLSLAALQQPPLAGQRLRTVFTYLTDVDAGGETDFPLLGLRVAPRRGRVVVFDNVHADGTPDGDTLHAGMPVVSGRKWLATLWLREQSLRHW